MTFVQEGSLAMQLHERIKSRLKLREPCGVDNDRNGRAPTRQAADCAARVVSIRRVTGDERFR